ncbi:PAS domain S-box protein [Ensifer adhaerens]|uniref:PAS domain S-box protein n=1 Tax=Ensifer adhaerens TaxID=106592 RepID=UPI001CBC80A4|nr:PAS domain S-box protein [Ensifer adhaerens]MBZ7925845.1 PAS domain S-box protein [Ensifer adhaerens]UAX94994.1 PAS domain S-box protein [Ensifer adhaerens]UAY03115.1 PAS domain S-box protein [Ensifer adhaerens]UAY11100.1 PAS domain S-box protein [Ensifer adhaerens]
MPSRLFDEDAVADDVLRARFAAMVESSFDAIVSKDLDGTVRTWNVTAERLFGYLADEMMGQPILTIIPPHLHEEEMKLLERLRRGERIEPFETVRQRKDGSYVTVSLTVSPIRNGAGKIVGASMVARDITSTKEKERRIRLLLREVNHRVRNQYAIILAMIRQSRSEASNAATFQKRIEERIWALAASHDLIASADWKGADLGDLVETQMAPFHPGDICQAGGPCLALVPVAIENLGMAIHELALNSLRGGVLKEGAGAISVRWTLAERGPIRGFSITWEERVLPGAEGPSIPQSGFGAVVLRRSAAQALSSTVDVACGDGMLRWRLAGPADRFLEPYHPAGAPAATEEP